MYREPGSRSTLPASAVCASFPALCSARSRRLQPGPLQQGRAGPRASTASQLQVPAQQHPAGRERSLLGGNQLRDSHSASSSHPEMKRAQRTVWGQQTGPGWCCPGPPSLCTPSRGGSGLLGAGGELTVPGATQPKGAVPSGRRNSSKFLLKVPK